MSSQQSPLSEISERVRQRVRELFPASDHEILIGLLQQYRMGKRGEGTERIHLDILRICNASVERIRQLVKLANTDYRDLIMAAEYDFVDGKIVKKKSTQT